MKLPLKPLLVFIAILICADLSFALAQQKKFPAYTGHVNDFANILDQQTKQKLELWLSNFEQMTGTQIAVVMVTSLEGRPLEDYTNELYRDWGIGAKTGEHKDKGALLLVALEDRKTRLEVGYGLEGDLPDGLAGEILRRMRSDLQQGQYSKAMTTGIRTLLDTLAEKWNVNIAGIEDRRYAYPPPAQGGGGGMGVFCVLIGIVLFFLMIAAISKANRRGGGKGGGSRPGASDMWWLFPIIFNSGGGSFGGGSWGNTGGGGDSGGSGWGGFGGGSSGGGGASDSW